MRYKARYWLNDRQYLAVLEDCMVIVTVDENGKMVRWAIFGNKEFKK